MFLCYFSFSLTTHCCTPPLFSQASTSSTTCCLWLGWRWELNSLFSCTLGSFHLNTQRLKLLTMTHYYRLANRAKRPIRMSWTSRVWSAPSFSQLGNAQKQRMSFHGVFFHVVHRSVNTAWVFGHTFFLSVVQQQSGITGLKPFPQRSVTTPGRSSVLYLASL